VVGSCEHGNEPVGSTKCCEFLEWLSRLLKKDLTLWSWLVGRSVGEQVSWLVS
jgi:hypothetical protein